MKSPAALACSESLIDAWKQACRQILTQNAVDYVLATSFGPAWTGSEAERKALDRAAKQVGAEGPSTVASMLVPRGVRRSSGTAEEAIEAGLQALGRGRRRGLVFSGWRHTYFERIVGEWEDKAGSRHRIAKNRLLDAIKKSVLWNQNFEAALYLHTNLEDDSFRTRGSPCLQYVQIRLGANNTVSLAALYRSHDFVNKALGNFIGLSDLGQFFASRTGRSFAGVDVISLNPFIQRKSQANGYISKV